MFFSFIKKLGNYLNSLVTYTYNYIKSRLIVSHSVSYVFVMFKYFCLI